MAVKKGFGQNKRFMPFAGKRVTVTGKTYIRGGSTAIVIDKIAEARGQYVLRVVGWGSATAPPRNSLL
jgi:hypothetical protein